MDECEENLESESFKEIQDEIMDIENTAILEDKEELEYITEDPVNSNQSNIGNSYFLVSENMPGEISKKAKKEESCGAFTIAPGEGQRPSNILTERHPFVLHFPCLFPDGKGGLHDESRKFKITPQQFLIQRIQNINSVFSKKQTLCLYWCELY